MKTKYTFAVSTSYGKPVVVRYDNKHDLQNDILAGVILGSCLAVSYEEAEELLKAELA